MRKNVAGQSVSAHLVSKTTGDDVTSGTTAVYVTVDNGTQATTGTATHKGNGEWSYAPSQAETNGNHVAYTFVNAAAVSATVNAYPLPYDPAALAAFLAADGPTLAEIAVAVRDVDNTTPADDSLGDAVNSAASAGDPWSTTLPGSYTGSQAGKIVGDNLNATVSSRAAASAWTSTLATDLGTYLGATGTPVADIAAAVRDVSNASPAASSLGAAVNSAASAGDPWSTTIPGSYGAGTAGKILGDNINATVSSRAAAGSWTPALAADLGTFLGATGTPVADIAEAVHAINNITRASVVDDATPTTTEFTGPSSLPSTDGFYSDPPCILAFTSGPLQGQARRVTGYTGATRTFTFEKAWPVAPADTTPFILFGVIED